MAVCRDGSHAECQVGEASGGVASARASIVLDKCEEIDGWNLKVGATLRVPRKKGLRGECEGLLLLGGLSRAIVGPIFFLLHKVTPQILVRGLFKGPARVSP